MTEKYDPYKNAIAERVNGKLKQEFEEAKHILKLDVKEALIKNTIAICNNQRPHLSNHMLTPVKIRANALNFH